MGYKQRDNNFSFTDLSLSDSMEKNRSISRMDKINAIINWYSIDQASPDHSTFSRFRSRLSKDAMTKINSEVLRQFTVRGLTINEGIAIDARLIQSASHPLSNEKLQEAKIKSESPEGKVDKNGKPLKYSRDIESDWTIKNNVAHFGLKGHASVDTKQGFVLATEITPASHHDSPYLPLCVEGSCHTQEPIKKVFADKGYFGKPNREFLSLNKIEDGIMRKATIEHVEQGFPK